MRLIDADELKKALGITSEDCNKCSWGSYESCGRGKEFEDICIAIDNAVTVDAVPVVRCRDCEWWTKQDKSLQGRCARYGTYPTGEWFCAAGRMDGKGNGNETD